jgi:hypothetical protein
MGKDLETSGCEVTEELMITAVNLMMMVCRGPITSADCMNHSFIRKIVWPMIAVKTTTSERSRSVLKGSAAAGEEALLASEHCQKVGLSWRKGRLPGHAR